MIDFDRNIESEIEAIYKQISSTDYDLLSSTRGNYEVFYPNKMVCYISDGLLNREGEPAVIHEDGSESYYVRGKLFRRDGPSLVRADGTKFYYLNSWLHREDGPAIIYPWGGGDYYFRNTEMTREEFVKNISLDNLKEFLMNSENF